MAALMKLRTIFVYTHDSIGLGEDGPTHQSIEHAAALRLIPGLDVWRPCDTVESAQAWIVAHRTRQTDPACLLFTRQNVPFQKRDAAQIAAIRARRLRARRLARRGGGAGASSSSPPARRSRWRWARASSWRRRASRCAWYRCRARACSTARTAAYRDAVLPRGIPRVAVEAGVTDYWRKYVGLDGAVVGIDTFGESAPAAALFEHFGFTVDNVVAAVRAA